MGREVYLCDFFLSTLRRGCKIHVRRGPAYLDAEIEYLQDELCDWPGVIPTHSDWSA